MRKRLALLFTTIVLAILAVLIWLIWRPLMNFLGTQGETLQSAQALLAIIFALGSLTSGLFWFLTGRKDSRIPPGSSVTTSVNTGGGANIQGNVSTGGGKVTGRDEYNITIYNIQHTVDEVWKNSPSLTNKEALQDATRAYLQYLLDRHSYLTMKGIGPAENIPLQLHLLDLYVPLKARRQLPKGETWERHLTLAGRPQAEIQHLGEPEPVLEILKEKDGLILLGDPGAGKSTFLKYLALKLARGEGDELGLAGRLPILIPLAAYGNALAEKEIRLDEFIAHYYDDLGCDFPLHTMLMKALENGKALLLLDGLDEVKDPALRNTVAERVADFYSAQRQKKRGNKFVLTSRIIGYRTVRTLAEGMEEATLVDFEDAEIEQFVTRWTKALEKQAQGDTAAARFDAEETRRELLNAISTNESVRRLAANPLLLTILALMKRKGVPLPERRVQLYEQYVNTLVRAWNRVRSISGREVGLSLDDVKTIRVLAPLALWMHEVNPSVGLVRLPDLYRKLEEIFTEQNDSSPEENARKFLDDIHEHTALLVERGAGEYGFIHQTFEEYLAAVALAFKAQGDAQIVADALIPHIGKQAWREVTLLTVSYIGIIQNLPRVAGQVAERLATAPESAPGEAAVLAGEAASDAWPDGITRESAQTVINALVTTMQNSAVKPDLRRRAGLALGKLGWTPPDLDEFVYIFPGRFIMGSDDFPDNPRREEEILYSYWMGKYPVTNLQFSRFINAGGYDERKWWSEDGWKWRIGEYDSQASDFIKPWLQQRSPEKRNQPWFWNAPKLNNPIFPVVGVSWFEAEAYCNWLTEQLSKFGEDSLASNMPFRVNQEAQKFWKKLKEGKLRVRLPTEKEWERAARYTDGREYPWKGEFDDARANVEQRIGTTSVCTYPLGQSQEGVWDLCGNVWEWCLDWYEKGITRSLRGGSWVDVRRDARCACRGRGIPYIFINDVGFRCVVSLALSES